MKTSEKIAIVGLGYVGCVSAACLAKIGHEVIGCDVSDYKVACVNNKEAPFFEPGLGEALDEVVSSGRLRATADLAEAVAASDIVMLCVGTPSAKNGNQSIEQIERVAREIGAAIADRERPLLVVTRSTVFPGTCEEVVAPALGRPDVAVVLSHPEFLREGTAIEDFMEPSLLVVGGAEPHRSRIAALYEGLPVRPQIVELRTAEMIKYACNAFHALKIAFANEIGAMSERQSIPAAEVMATLCEDEALNISKAYLKPGFAFGGSCLPKDLRALVYRGSRLDMDLPLLNSVLPSNESHLQRAVDKILDLGPVKLGFFGLTFKENTDDLRESPTIALLEQLIGKGREVRVFDPNLALEKIYGANQRFLMERIPHIGRLMQTDLAQMTEWADHLVLAQKPGKAYAEALKAGGKPSTNLVGGNPLG
ncbi:MAG: nucleotide sugar dehydrogenase [Acidobacteria bacterium]|nr:nucleotide sugar dehydrogenase [Acidobacteriota bacterium]